MPYYWVSVMQKSVLSCIKVNFGEGTAEQWLRFLESEITGSTDISIPSAKAFISSL